MNYVICCLVDQSLLLERWVKLSDTALGDCRAYLIQHVQRGAY